MFLLVHMWLFTRRALHLHAFGWEAHPPSMPIATATCLPSRRGRIALILAATAVAVVDLPEPGMPAMPTMSLHIIWATLISCRSRICRGNHIERTIAGRLYLLCVRSEASSAL